MKPTQVLMQEHRVIEQVLNCLAAMSSEFKKSGRIDAADARDALQFFRNFADKCHHMKEEDRLFPAMEARGFSPDCGPTAVMRYEHENGRAHILAMSQAIDAGAQGDATALEQFLLHAGQYIEMLRQHIQKEDHCLFPMADNSIAPPDQEKLMKQFEQAEIELGEGVHEGSLEIARRLSAKYNVSPEPEARQAMQACGCGHSH